MYYLDVPLMKQDYEEHVRWLQGLYGSQTTPTQPGRVSRWAKRLRYALGGQLVSLGERMQFQHDLPTSSSIAK